MPISAQLSVRTDARSAKGYPDLLSCASQHATIRAALQYCAARGLDANALWIANQPRSARHFACERGCDAAHSQPRPRTGGLI